MRRSIATALSLGCTLLMQACSTPPASPPAGDCAGHEVRATDLIGVWVVQLFESTARRSENARPLAAASHPAAPPPATRQGLLALQTHPDYPGSLRGQLQWPLGLSQVAADLDGDTFTMEESEDGQRIAATWLGTLVKGECGRSLQGVRLGDGGAATEGPAFSMQRR